MKPVQLLSAALLITLAAAFTSCKPSKVWATKEKDRSDKDRKEYSERRDDDDRYDDRNEGRYETTPPPLPRSYRYTQLVISPTPGFVMNRYPDGRFYHRSPEGFIYWKAPDNRFFLDRAHIHRVNYNRNDYDRWREYYRAGSGRRY
jgi:hypothetical protein